MFILHTYSVGGAERRCVRVANYLAEHGVNVKLVLLDVHKMYACKPHHNGLEIDICLVDAPKVSVPVHENVEVVYLLHDGEETLVNEDITCVPYERQTVLPYDADASFTAADMQAAKAQLKQLEDLYIRRIYAYVKRFPAYKVVSWMTFCNIATAAALQTLPNDFAFAECTSPDIEFPKDSVFNLLKRHFYPRAQAAFFQTEEMRRFYTYLPRLKTYVIPNPIMENLPMPSTAARNRNIVTFCRVEKPKNLPLLIQAFGLLYEQYPDYRLHIYGDGSEKQQLLSLVKEKALQEVVTFFDFTPHVHEEVLHDAMFVSTSDREGISNSMIEAMAIGLPTICTDCHGGGARATIRHGENGLLVPMGDALALVEAMTAAIRSPELAATLSDNGAAVRTMLSISNIGNMWMTALGDDWAMKTDE